VGLSAPVVFPWHAPGPRRMPGEELAPRTLSTAAPSSDSDRPSAAAGESRMAAEGGAGGVWRGPAPREALRPAHGRCCWRRCCC